MKNKIKEALKTKHSGLGVSDAVLDGLASFLSQTVKEESQIADAVENSGGLLSSFQTETNRRVNKLVDDNKKLTDSNEELNEKLKLPIPPKTPKSGEEEDEKEPQWAKDLKEQQKLILEDRADRDKTSAKQAKLDKARDLMLEKGVDKKLCDKMLTLATIDSTDDDTVETIAERGVTEYNDFVSDFTPKGSTPRQSEHSVTDEAKTDFFAKKKAENKSKNEEIANLKQ